MGAPVVNTVTSRQHLHAPAGDPERRIASRSTAAAAVFDASVHSIVPRSFMAQRDHGIDAHGPACGHRASEQGRHDEHHERARKRCWVPRRHTCQCGLEHATGDQSEQGANSQPRHQRPEALCRHEAQHIAPRRAERDSQANFTRAPVHRVRDHGVKPNRGKHRRDEGKNRAHGPE